ncbi:MAG TPA: CHAP domain-containing protein [Thermoanaerobaculia bacterium]|nr:CHAP domain-containing protein [Thermoanaerobaculia bacterium]
MEPIQMTTTPLPYPGKVVKRGHRVKGTVLAVQRRLSELGCGPVDEDGDFGKQTHDAVLLFQARFTDTDGLPLQRDGEIGAITWASLFGEQSVTVSHETSSDLLTEVLAFAVTQIGVRETTPNRGPEVDEYVKSVGLDPAGRFAWCVAFVYFCFDKAAKKLGRTNPMIKTAGVLDHWNKAGLKGIPRVTATQAKHNPSLVKPGHIFVIDTGPAGGAGHTGLVERVIGGKLVTIEGNTNEGGSREGVGVFRRTQRTVVSINKGFINYGSR